MPLVRSENRAIIPLEQHLGEPAFAGFSSLCAFLAAAAPLNDVVSLGRSTSRDVYRNSVRSQPQTKSSLQPFVDT